MGLTTEKRNATSSLEPENRGERQFVRVPLPFEVEMSGQTLQGRDLSLDGFALAEVPPLEHVTGVIDARLRLLFKGCELTFQAEAKPVEDQSGNYGTAFQIMAMDDAQREVLRKTIRAYLAGQLITFEGLLLPSDVQTERQRQQRENEEDEADAAAASPWQRATRYGLLACGSLLLFGFLAASVYQRLTIIESRYAAVTAPRIDIRAPASGRLDAHEFRAGTNVERGQILTRVFDADLEAEIALLEGERRLLLGDSAVQVASSNGLRRGATPWGSLSLPIPPNKATLAATQVEHSSNEEGSASAQDQHNTMAEQSRWAELSNIRLAALRYRETANKLYANCNCEVFWSVPEGEWVEKGELVFSLVSTEEDDLTIEALVHMKNIHRIEPLDEAYLVMPQTGELIAARVLAVRLDPDRGPRAGFPSWVARDESLASVELVPSEPLPTHLIGVPTKVIFSAWPGLTHFVGGS